MKVLGISGQYNNSYICEVSHDELCNLMNKSTGGDNSLAKLKVGETMNLGEGYNFLYEIRSACRDLVDAHKSFGNAQKTMIKFAEMMKEKEE